MNIYIHRPQGYIHSNCFNEVALAMRDGYKALGRESEIIDAPVGQCIIFGWHLMEKIPPEAIVFNLEQLHRIDYRLAHNEVWDYSLLNIEFLRDHGIEAKQIEIGYSPSLTDIEPKKEDIDVLFYGSVSARRSRITDELLAHDVKVKSVFGCYGKELKDLIARSKIVLNLHYKPHGIFEIVRCSYLMANKKCIVSEFGSDHTVEYPYKKAIQFCNYINLTKSCLYYLTHDEERLELGQKGFEIFSKRRQELFLC